MSASGLGYAAAAALAAIFAIAAVAKLRDLDTTEREFTALGLPRAPFFARFVPLVELSIVALLMIVPPAGSIAALVSLAFFTTFLVGRLRAGVRVPCACFGAARARPISALDVVRNVLLMALAAVALATDRPVRIGLVDAVVILALVTGAAALLHMAGRVRDR